LQQLNFVSHKNTVLESPRKLYLALYTKDRRTDYAENSPTGNSTFQFYEGGADHLLDYRHCSLGNREALVQHLNSPTHAIAGYADQSLIRVLSTGGVHYFYSITLNFELYNLIS